MIDGGRNGHSDDGDERDLASGCKLRIFLARNYCIFENWHAKLTDS